MPSLYVLTAGMAACLCCSVASGQNRTIWTRFRPSVTLQTGFARTFQLNLGGAFGDGPAWQNRAIIDFPNLLTTGDAISANGWMTIDTPSHRRDWIGGIAYRAPAFRAGRGTVTLTAGWQRWLFPSVLGGVRDHLVAFNGTYRTQWKLPITLTADHWVIVDSPLQKGHLTLLQGNVAHQLFEGHGLRLVLRHGPSTSYSYKFWNKPGWRVFRYGGSITLDTRGAFTLEGAVRQQAGIAASVPDYSYWSVLLTRRL